MNTPLVSICIPAYRCEKTIKEAVTSALNQTYTNLEIIIVDDCSPDHTYEILQTIKDDRIRLFKNDRNLGMCGNWNKCMAYSRGEYIHFLHCDDVISPDCISKKVEVVKTHRDIVLVFSATEIINANNKTLMIRRYKTRDVLEDGLSCAYKSLYRRNIYGEPSNVLFKKNIADEVNGFCPELKYVTDWDLWIRISAYGDVYYINNVLSKYRVSASNVTSSLMISNMLEDDSKMINNLKKFKMISLPSYRILLHRIIYFARACVRYVYMRFWANYK